jgi:HD-like signal output (HDOD) protein
VAIAVLQYMSNSIVSGELLRYRQYSLACAVACAEISRCTSIQPSLAFSCGLLHDLGRLALMTTYPSQYANLFAASESLFGRNQLLDLAQQERLLFGFDRFQTGEWLVEEWRLPPIFRRIVGKFAIAKVSVGLDLVALTRTGCSLVNSLGYGLMSGAPRRSVEDIKSALPSSVT